MSCEPEVFDGGQRDKIGPAFDDFIFIGVSVHILGDRRSTPAKCHVIFVLAV